MYKHKSGSIKPKTHKRETKFILRRIRWKKKIARQNCKKNSVERTENVFKQKMKKKKK